MMCRKLIVGFTLIFSLSACASYYGAVNIQSNPPGAQVVNLEDDSIIGITPTTYLHKANNNRRQTIILRFKKAGFYDKTTSLWMNLRHTSEVAALEKAQTVSLELQTKGLDEIN